MVVSLSGSDTADPDSLSVTWTMKAARVLWVQTSAFSTLHFKCVRTAHTSESKPGLSLPVNSITVRSVDDVTPMELVKLVSEPRTCGKYTDTITD